MSLKRMVGVGAVLLLVGCAGSAPGPAVSPEAGPRLVVKNHSAFDMDIYLNLRSQQIPLGIAAADSTTRFALPEGQVAGAGFVTFEAVPITGGGEAASSEPTDVPPDGEITLDIPPP